MGWMKKIMSPLFIFLALLQSGGAGKIVPNSYIIKYTNSPINEFNSGIIVEDYYPHINAYSIEADCCSLNSILQNTRVTQSPHL